jgi:hypothetical protein
MSKIITREHLWDMSAKQVSNLVKGKTVKVIITDGNWLYAIKENVSVASDHSQLFCDFLKSDGHWIFTENIKAIEL